MKPGNAPLQSIRLLDQVHERIRCMHYSLSTEKTYLQWVKFFVRWHGRNGVMRHPREMAGSEIEALLTMLATERKVAGVLANMEGITALLARLLYGTGMRLMEGMRLRIKDVDFDRHVIIVRDAKGGKDRVVMLPRSLAPALRQQMLSARSYYLCTRCYKTRTSAISKSITLITTEVLT
jgi:integrase